MHKFLLAAGLAAAMITTAAAPAVATAHDHHWRYEHRHDHRYYRHNDNRGCRNHNAGTTGAVIGALGGAAIGNSVSRGNRLPGTLLGAGVGAYAGHEIGKHNC